MMIKKCVFQTTDYRDWISFSFDHILSSLLKNMEKVESNETKAKGAAQKQQERKAKELRVSFNIEKHRNFFHKNKCGALRDLVLFVQF